jgi:glycosyltransferase involved in cell wall biosynthesis
MRIMIAHNRYQQHGGEDNVVVSESELLQAHGHEVTRFDVDNDHIQGLVSRIATAAGSVYSLPSKHRVQKAIAAAKPEIVHVHNFFPTLSPSVFYACEDAGVPVVHTLHNYRIVCCAPYLFREGHVCEECITERSPLPGIVHACYRSSHIGSAVASLGMAFHHEIGTWSKKIAAFIALNEFAANKIGGYRVPREKIIVKPNFSVDLGVGTGDGGYALFVGRMSPEKGIQTLIDADAAGSLTMDVVLLGDGPMREAVVRAQARPGSRLISKGFMNHDQIIEYMSRASVLIMPSIWYESGPLVVIEALSLGLPVIAAALGNVAQLISTTGAGLLYEPGSPAGLSAALAEYALNPQLSAEMRHRARSAYEASHTPEKNYERLMEIYEGVIRGTLFKGAALPA